MPLTLSLRFPTGRYAAAAWDDREKAEWPPHPARLALAFIDVLHKAGNPDHLRAALDWFCQLGAPTLVLPSEDRMDARVMDGFFVPQNPSEATGPKHPRKARAFPTVHLDPDHPTVFLHWPDAEPDASQLESLQELAARLPRFGHSSSLVVAAANCEPPPAGEGWTVILPAEDSITPAEHRLRVPYAGLLDAAEKVFAASEREKEMQELVRQSVAKAKTDKMLKPAASPRGRHDPRHHWIGYSEAIPEDMPASSWDDRILILARTNSDRIGLVATWRWIEILHKTLLDRWSRDPGRGPVPGWISGHRPGQGITAPTTANHLSLFPLADVGHAHASGRLMGIGIAFPRPETAGIDSATLRLEWRKAMAALFPQGELLQLRENGDEAGLILQPADPTETRKSLQQRRWSRASRHWHSVTPVVFDRHPKPHFSKDPHAWAASCRKIIIESCRRIGLPEPDRVDVAPYSPLPGVPPSPAFPPPAARAGRPARAHFHVALEFPRKVRGPVLLGAGRFRGYGLLAPID